jgi:hypothetical protein
MTDESELEQDLWDAVTWIGLLDKIVDYMENLPSMSKREIDLSYGQLLSRVGGAEKSDLSSRCQLSR